MNFVLLLEKGKVGDCKTHSKLFQPTATALAEFKHWVNRKTWCVGHANSERFEKKQIKAVWFNLGQIV